MPRRLGAPLTGSSVITLDLTLDTVMQDLTEIYETLCTCYDEDIPPLRYVWFLLTSRNTYAWLRTRESDGTHVFFF